MAGCANSSNQYYGLSACNSNEQTHVVRCSRTNVCMSSIQIPSESMFTYLHIFHTPCCIILQHILETVSVGTRQTSRSRATYLQVYEFLHKHVEMM